MMQNSHVGANDSVERVEPVYSLRRQATTNRTMLAAPVDNIPPDAKRYADVLRKSFDAFSGDEYFENGSDFERQLITFVEFLANKLIEDNATPPKVKNQK